MTLKKIHDKISLEIDIEDANVSDMVISPDRKKIVSLVRYPDGEDYTMHFYILDLETNTLTNYEVVNTSLDHFVPSQPNPNSIGWYGEDILYVDIDAEKFVLLKKTEDYAYDAHELIWDYSGEDFTIRNSRYLHYDGNKITYIGHGADSRSYLYVLEYDEGVGEWIDTHIMDEFSSWQRIQRISDELLAIRIEGAM